MLSTIWWFFSSLGILIPNKSLWDSNGEPMGRNYIRIHMVRPWKLRVFQEKNLLFDSFELDSSNAIFSGSLPSEKISLMFLRHLYTELCYSLLGWAMKRTARLSLNQHLYRHFARWIQEINPSCKRWRRFKEGFLRVLKPEVGTKRTLLNCEKISLMFLRQLYTELLGLAMKRTARLSLNRHRYTETSRDEFRS